MQTATGVPRSAWTLALGVLIAAIALVGLVSTASAAESLCVATDCRHVAIGTPGPTPDGSTLPTHDPCVHDAACGGAAVALGSLLTAAVASTGLLRGQPGSVGPALRAVSSRLPTLLLAAGLDRPPRCLA